MRSFLSEMLHHEEREEHEVLIRINWAVFLRDLRDLRGESRVPACRTVSWLQVIASSRN